MASNRDSALELEQRLAKLKEIGIAATPSSDHDLALHFSRVFGHSPAATHLSPPLESLGEQTLDSGKVSQSIGTLYFVPEDSKQDEIEKILADSEDLLIDEEDHDLSFLDTANTGLTHEQTRELKDAFNMEDSISARKTGQQELDHVAKELETTLSKFLQSHQSPRFTEYTDKSGATPRLESGIDSAFGDQLDRLTGIPLVSGTSADFGDHDEASNLITRIRESAALEAKYGTKEDEEVKSLSSRHDELKKGIQGLSSVREVQAAKMKTQTSLGPVPTVIDLSELRTGSGDIDENPDSWCCICNEDATWTCPGCDNDHFCQDCYRESHLGITLHSHTLDYHSTMVALTGELAETDSLYCNPTEDGGSTKGSARSVKSVQSSTSSVKSGSNVSTKTKSTSRSKSSTTSSIPKTAAWKAAVDPLGMSSKAVGPGFMPMFSTSLYSPGFQVASSNGGGPKAFQSKQLRFVEKKKATDGTKSSAASTKSGKSGLSTKSGQSAKSTKTMNSEKSTKSADSSSTSSSTKSSFFSALKETLQGPTQLEQDDNAVEAGGDTKSTVNASESMSPAGTDQATVESAFPLAPTSVPVARAAVASSARPIAKELVPPISTESITGARKPSWTPPPSIVPSSRDPKSLTSSAKELFRKRIVTWEYLSRVFNGHLAYYNTIVLSEADLRKHFSPEVVLRRTLPLFLLGNSIAQLLDIPHIPDFMKAFSVVLGEFEHFVASSGSRSKMNFFGRRVSDGRSFEESGEYTYLEVKSVPFDMDYTIVFTTLCEVIAEAYSKFDTQDPSTSLTVVDHDHFHKIENRLKKLSQGAFKDLDSLSREVMQEELNLIDPIGSISGDWDQQALALGF
ncbi:hypothetical protein EMPS_00273 [Entomortierella parvispora]|uniref:Uncharacterized protein n=1 Tax=Entomortierella parvispora TaxID=205924 RepID=A0A9P3LRQ0_9FUNG|nr:hypothetical protein EMPS_00273 [Entomortierella parvispora]